MRQWQEWGKKKTGQEVPSLGWEKARMRGMKKTWQDVPSPEWERARVRGMKEICSFFVFSLYFFCFSQPGLALTVIELTKTPVAFDQKPVTVVGEVANVVTRYGDKPYTTFDLLDAEDTSLPIFIWGKPTFKQGEVCRVTGTFTVEKKLETHVLDRGVEAEKVEKLPATEHGAESLIFRKKKKTGLHGARGFYLPQ